METCLTVTYDVFKFAFYLFNLFQDTGLTVTYDVFK